MVINRQRGIRIPVRGLNEFLASALRALRLPPEALTLCLVTNAQMARWNRAYRGKNSPTDVLSFPAHTAVNAQVRKRRNSKSRAAENGVSSAWFTSSASLASYLGDIAIAPAVARQNARRFGRTFHDEMRILILHGMLHLMGYDHETDSGQMERRERHLRRRLGLG